MKPAASRVSVLSVDDFLLAVDKPPGITVIPEAYQQDSPCLVRILEAEWGRLWVVHRIDRDTSGIVLIARTAEAHRELNEQFSHHLVRKTYHLIVRGTPAWEETRIEASLRPDGDSRHRTVVDGREGKRAVTSFRVLARFGRHALLEACPETGRTHQIRVHAICAGHAIVADPLYGDGEPLTLSSLKRGYKGELETERPLLDRIALHAQRLRFAHPASGTEVDLVCPYPRDMRAAIAQLERCSLR